MHRLYESRMQPFGSPLRSVPLAVGSHAGDAEGSVRSLCNTLPRLKVTHSWLSEAPGNSLVQVFRNLHRLLKDPLRFSKGFPRFLACEMCRVPYVEQAVRDSYRDSQLKDGPSPVPVRSDDGPVISAGATW